MNHKIIGNIFKGDKVIWMVFFFLCMISIVEVYSASSSLSYKSGNFIQPVIKHTGILLLGFFTIICIIKVKCKYFKLATMPLLGLSVVLLLIVLAAGHSTNGASRWMDIMGMQFQPSELAKGAMVLATAQILSAMQTENGAAKKAIVYILVISFFVIGLIGVENMSTAILLSTTIFLMMYLGRVPGKQLLILMGVVGSLVALFLCYVLIFGHVEEKPQSKENTLTEQVDTNVKKDKGIFHRADTWKARIVDFFDFSYVAPEDVDLDKDAQKVHSKIAIASSNIIGRGPGNSVERDFLSQAFSDFIYAIIIEELGVFIGGAGVAFLYIVLLYRAGRIANRCENNFPAFFAMGLAILLVTQALFNMAVAVGAAPVTGQPLPLISRGGTSTVINCLYVGCILSISRWAKKKDGSVDEDVEDEMDVA